MHQSLAVSVEAITATTTITKKNTVHLYKSKKEKKK
jgi:hypothetical protein